MVLVIELHWASWMLCVCFEGLSPIGWSAKALTGESPVLVCEPTGFRLNWHFGRIPLAVVRVAWNSRSFDVGEHVARFRLRRAASSRIVELA